MDTVFKKQDVEGGGGGSHVPFDRALEVGLADRAVVDEDRGAGAVLFRQEPRGHLQRDRERVKDAWTRPQRRQSR